MMGEFRGGVLHLPPDWRERLVALLAEPDVEKRREMVSDLDDRQRASLGWEWQMEKRKRAARKGRKI